MYMINIYTYYGRREISIGRASRGSVAGEGFVGVSLWYNDAEGATLPAGHYNEGDGDGYIRRRRRVSIGLRLAVWNIIHVSPDDPVGCGRMALFNTLYIYIYIMYNTRPREVCI